MFLTDSELHKTSPFQGYAGPFLRFLDVLGGQKRYVRFLGGVLAFVVFANQAWATESASPAFDILEFEVEGNTVLPNMDIERAVLPFMGEGKQVADVELARAALEKAYHDKGFLTVFVDIPEQRIDAGVIALQVTEGRVERLRVTGSRYYAQGEIRRQVSELQGGKVPNFNIVQAQLAELNRGEARRVQPLLRQGALPGTVETELQVQDRLPLGANLELNNRHAYLSVPTRLSFSAHYDNLWQREHGLTLTAITAPAKPSESRVFLLNYGVPVGEGKSWSFSGLWFDSLSEPLGAASVAGKGYTLSANYFTPIWVGGALAGFSHSFTAGVSWKDSREHITTTLPSDDVSNAGGSEFSTPVKYLPLTLAYHAAWLQDGGGQTQLSTNGLFNSLRLVQRQVDCAGVPTDQFACKGNGVDGGFATLKMDLRHAQPLLNGWALRGRLAGQLSTGPLISAEQFTLGGADSVRGYYEAEASGDFGALASIELHAPNWASKVQDRIKNLTDLSTFAFVDAGRVMLVQPAVGQTDRTSIFSNGLGLRLGLSGSAGRSASAAIDIAWPLRRTSATEAHDPKVHLRLNMAL